LLGLTYKPGTDTLRRSIALRIASDLAAAGAEVAAFDPMVRALPPGAPPVRLESDAAAAFAGADALVLATEWPEFGRLDWSALARRMRRPLVFDLKGLVAPGTAGLELRRIGVSP
jgi:UDPglucose 6-dehydrogenase